MSTGQAPASSSPLHLSTAAKGLTTRPATRQAKQRAMVAISHMTSVPSTGGLHSRASRFLP